MGDKSPRWNTLLTSLLVLSKQLEKFGLVYANNEVIVIESEIPISL